MDDAWRNTLTILLPQFEARATQSFGLNHLFVEAAEDEREKLSGPDWFKPFGTRTISDDGTPLYDKWESSAFRTLPRVAHNFRAFQPSEHLENLEPSRIIHDLSGIARAIAVPSKQRCGYLCGKPADHVNAFESLANSAAAALAGARRLEDHPFASELTDLFRKPRGGIRYVFGDIPTPPSRFVADGWNAGILKGPHGVLIDLPLAESKPDAAHWLLLLHRLGWRGIPGSGFSAERHAWNQHGEVTLDFLREDWSSFPVEFRRQFEGLSGDSFYSVLGSKDTPLDVNLTSALAIRILLSDLSARSNTFKSGGTETVDYSREGWSQLPLPMLRSSTKPVAGSAEFPRIGILVATGLERDAVLRRMLPSGRKRTVQTVHLGNNTFYVGRLGVTTIALSMSSMGSSGRDASINVTRETIAEWNVPAVISVGIAFGRDPVKQRTGNVLVSERIIPYEPERVGASENQSRGRELPASALLLDRFRNTVGWSFLAPDGQTCGTQCGAILSGEKLVDNMGFRDSLFERFPTAIGGEMEGGGIAAAADRERRHWIVVKGICDWADGNKSDQHQGFAAAAAIDLVVHVLNQVGALDHL